jgi:hypothetical protein
VPVLYKEMLVGEGRADLVVGQRVVLELKALPPLGGFAAWRLSSLSLASADRDLAQVFTPIRSDLPQ